MTLESEIIRRFGGREVTTGDLVTNFQLTPKAAKAVANMLASERTRANPGAAWVYRISETPPKKSLDENLSGKQKALFEALQDGKEKTVAELIEVSGAKDKRALRAAVSYLREQLANHDIVAVYGVGYRMVAR